MKRLTLWGEAEEIAEPSAPPSPKLENLCCPNCGTSNLSKEDMRSVVVGAGRRRHLEDVCRTCGAVIRYVEPQWHREWRVREQRIERIEAEMKQIAYAVRDWVTVEETDALEARIDAIFAETADEFKAAQTCLAEMRRLGKIAEQRRAQKGGAT